ncbi:phospholipase A1-like [Atheta coriaria]|uniref:phospholipase A1-like n=1 Tax=Dalotia coriaria TaxID=877792 RepID=UPI0031F41CE9
MKILIVFIVAITASTSLARRYSAREEKQNDNKSFAIIPDEQGNPHFVDLRQPKVDPNVTLADLNIYFYSPSDPTRGIHLSPENFDGSIPSDEFDPSKKSVFIAHGWTGSNTSGTCVRVRREVLKNGNANIFVIDWHRVSHEFYTLAAMGVNDLGKMCGEFVDKMLSKYNIDAKLMMLAGESLGGHLVGACGSAMKKKPGAVVGLDPAQPMFHVDEPGKRLSIDDGEVVHVLHTNVGFLGFESSIGHADYFANGGGINQPGCGADVVGICAHGRAPVYFEESINSHRFKSLVTLLRSMRMARVTITKFHTLVDLIWT